MTNYPTSSDIYLEVEGKKVAVVQGYSAAAKKQNRTIEAFGEEEPVATIAGQPTYSLDLTRLYVTGEAMRDGLSFYDLDDFSLVIVKPDKKIIFTGCNWSDITETGKLSEMVLERVAITAARRMETAI